jgi:hypothetical protein
MFETINGTATMWDGEPPGSEDYYPPLQPPGAGRRGAGRQGSRGSGTGSGWLAHPPLHDRSDSGLTHESTAPSTGKAEVVTVPGSDPVLGGATFGSAHAPLSKLPSVAEATPLAAEGGGGDGGAIAAERGATEEELLFGGGHVRDAEAQPAVTAASTAPAPLPTLVNGTVVGTYKRSESAPARGAVRSGVPGARAEVSDGPGWQKKLSGTNRTLTGDAART